jgi:hypothetical protein
VSARRISVVSVKRAALSVVGQSPVTRLTRTYKGFRAFGLASGAVASDGKSGTRVCADDGFGMPPDRHLQWISQKC